MLLGHLLVFDLHSPTRLSAPEGQEFLTAVSLMLSKYLLNRWMDLFWEDEMSLKYNKTNVRLGFIIIYHFRDSLEKEF